MIIFFYLDLVLKLYPLILDLLKVRKSDIFGKISTKINSYFGSIKDFIFFNVLSKKFFIEFSSALKWLIKGKKDKRVG